MKEWGLNGWEVIAGGGGGGGTVNDSTITLKQHDGTVIDDFTVNQDNNKDILLPDYLFILEDPTNFGKYLAIDGNGKVVLVPAPEIPALIRDIVVTSATTATITTTKNISTIQYHRIDVDTHSTASITGSNPYTVEVSGVDLTVDNVVFLID
ncbi:MAG: hypothetical protein LBE56_12440 [Tannerella sp.]|nr:hypothetical protein [Tannerella sp.]